MYKRNNNIEENVESSIQTRSKSAKKCIVKKPNIESYKRSIIFSGATTWNAPKAETKNVDIFEAFKYHQKRRNVILLKIQKLVCQEFPIPLRYHQMIYVITSIVYKNVDRENLDPRPKY